MLSHSKELKKLNLLLKNSKARTLMKKQRKRFMIFLREKIFMNF